jgi:uncharacterized protein YecE (DUF72 family)
MVALVEGTQCRVAVGVAGWSYPDWEGFVYPPGIKDPLEYVSQFVDVVEINSTFYRPPDARTAASWERRTAHRPEFFFTAKIHQDVTHRGRVDAALVAAFRTGLQPLRDAGRLQHLLAQFKWDFADTPDARAHLERVRDAFAGPAALTLELRHSSWQGPAALAFLKGLGVSVACLDYPLAHNSFSMRLTGVGDDAYLRLHGRNAKAWFSKGAGRDETYNYLYSPAEVADIAKRGQEIARMSSSLTVIANNHYQGKEMVNALQLKAHFAKAHVAVPAPLRERYPALREIAD